MWAEWSMGKIFAAVCGDVTLMEFWETAFSFSAWTVTQQRMHIMVVEYCSICRKPMYTDSFRY
jgi:hypothetical protein